jgi:hypothetical protein
MRIGLSYAIFLLCINACNSHKCDNKYSREVFKSNSKIDSVEYYKNGKLYLTEYEDGCNITPEYYGDTIVNMAIDTPSVRVYNQVNNGNESKKVFIDYKCIHYSYWTLRLLNKLRIDSLHRNRLKNTTEFIIVNCKSTPIFQLEKKCKDSTIILIY